MGFRAARIALLSLVPLLSTGAGASAFTAATGAPDAPRTQQTQTDKPDRATAEVYRMVDTLALSTTGKTLIERAVRFWGLQDWKELRTRVTLGHVSRTDAVLTRHFNPITGEERRERNVTITIRAAQPFGERVLDFAHELTHAIAEPAWDPYDPGLTAGKYIHASLEAKGGEVEAVYIECAVAKELLDLGQSLSGRCERYFPAIAEAGAGVDRELVQKDFYRVGKWKDDVLRKLGPEVALFPHLSAQAPELYSATGGAPYPVSLIREYEELNRIACENARRRLRAGRSPAATAATTLLRARCQAADVDAESSVAQTRPVAPVAPFKR